MISFAFISGDEFRLSLENDYNELIKSIKSENWKSVHVLAGSIIEAVLIDYLIAVNYKDRKPAEILKMNLHEAISACKEEKILSEKTAELSSVVKTYRNLIHPGRTIRLNETVSKQGAVVAEALVEMICEEIAVQKSKTYGYTAEQIVAKLELDSNATAIIPHLLKSTNLTEKTRLLLKTLPSVNYRLNIEHASSDVLYSISNCFRLIFGQVSDEIKQQSLSQYVKMLKEDSADVILFYENAFLLVYDLDFLSDTDETELILEHLLSRLRKQVEIEIIVALQGVGKHLKKARALKYIDPLIQEFTYYTHENLSYDTISSFISQEAFNFDSETQKLIVIRLNTRKNGNLSHTATNALDQMIAAFEVNDEEFPF